MARAEVLDLSSLRLTAGEGRRLELTTTLDTLLLGGERYGIEPSEVPVAFDISRTVGRGYAMRLRFSAALTGPCARCLEPAAPEIEVDSREVHQPGEDDVELLSPYVDGANLDIAAWARDALVLALGSRAILCNPECLGLCPVCGEDLNTAGPDHAHEVGPDPRWAKLRELRFE